MENRLLSIGKVGKQNMIRFCYLPAMLTGPWNLREAMLEHHTGAIDNFNDVQYRTSTQWINCENRDVMEGIAFMKPKHKGAGMGFEYASEDTQGCKAKSRKTTTRYSVWRFYQTKLPEGWATTAQRHRNKNRTFPEGSDGLFRSEGRKLSSPCDVK